jgi:branched-chain amino acid transport system substrate-binding protein
VRYRNLVALGAAVALMAGCGTSSTPVAGTAAAATPSPSAAAPAATTAEPIVIGASISLSGDFSDAGESIKKGDELWAEAINAKGGLLGHQVSFKFANDASSTDQVVQNYQNLITVDHVDLTFGPFSSFLTIPASVVAARYGYLFASPASGSPQVFNRGLNNVFHVQPATGIQSMQVFANWVLSLPADQRPKTAAYATEDDPLISPAIEGVRETLEGAGITTAYDHIYPIEVTDYTPFGFAIASSNADVVVLGTNLPDSVAFIEIFAQQHYNPKAMIEFNGPDQGKEFTDKVGLNSEGVMKPAGWFPQLPTFGNADFVAAYIAKFGGTAGDIPGDVAEAYSVGQQYEQAAEQAQSIDNAKLIEAFHSGMTFKSVQGDWSYDSVGRPSGSGILGQWVGGEFVAVWPDAMKPVQYPKVDWQQ